MNAVTLAVIGGVLMPPAIYDRPYAGYLTIQREDPKVITSLCREAGARTDRMIRACAIVRIPVCIRSRCWSG
mgnify:CR=1 FL=1